MRVVIADPPAYTPWYDHELASALARAGADVELATSRFRFADLPAAEGYRRVERFYPLSSRLFRRSFAHARRSISPSPSSCACVSRKRRLFRVSTQLASTCSRGET